MATYGSLFTGFGGADIGAIDAGLTPLWGVEYDAKIAAVANSNLGEHVRVANILECNPANFVPVDVLHASPPCPNFSVAKAGGEETANDIALAQKVIDFVDTLNPTIFTLENVWAYRNSKSWRMIENTLYGAGYWLDIEHINTADFAVPQTRKRMIVRAVRGAWVPMLPAAERWIGWYAAIEDLIPSLPETQFAPWQLERLPVEMRTKLYAAGGYDGAIVGVNEQDPSMTITANHNQLQLRAFLVGKNQDKFGDGIRQWSEQVQTIGANEHGSKAFVVDCQNAGSPSPERERGLTIRMGDEPLFTLTASMGVKRPTRAAVNGKVVAMTPRCLARFQSFPDNYVLPDSKTLAAKGIGNAVPPLLMKKIYQQLLTT